MNPDANPDMNELHERAVILALDPYAQELRSVHPSPALDARVDATLKAWSDENAGRRLVWHPLFWGVAAASIAAVAAGVALLVARDGHPNSAPSEPSTIATLRPELQLHGESLSDLSAGQVSLWPAEAAIFRVKASLTSTGERAAPGKNTNVERQYWVDVRIANDGTMRIVQVLPADRTHFVPHE